MKGGDKKWQQRKVRKQLAGRVRRAAGDLRRDLQADLPEEKDPRRAEPPRGENKRIKPEMAAENL